MDVKILSGVVQIEKLQDFLRELNSISSTNDVTIQALNADRIAGERHIQFAANKAIRAMDTGNNVAKDLGVEIMRYASGKRQIEGAFSMGLHEGENRAAFIVVGDEKGMEKSTDKIREMMDERPLVDYNPEKRDEIISQFNITDMELEAVGEEKIPELVIERVALVDIMK